MLTSQTLSDGQIEKLAGKIYKQWFEKVVAEWQARVSPERETVAAWLGPRQSGLVKSLGDVDTEIKNYLLLGKERRGTADPDAVKQAARINQAVSVALTRLRDMDGRMQVTELGETIKAEADWIERTRKVAIVNDKTGAHRAADSTGKILPDREVRGGKEGGLDVGHARRLLAKFEELRATARQAKATYVKLKMEAKGAYAEYEGLIKKLKPEYHARTIDWDTIDLGDTEALAKLMNEPGLGDYLRGQLLGR